MITFRDVNLTYRTQARDVPALSGLTLELRDGEMLAILGANGSGKSTLALLADGLLHPDSGSIEVDGVDTRDASRIHEIRSLVGLVMQDPDDQIVATSVAEEVAFGPENLGLPRDQLRERVAWALSAVGLDGFDEREPHTLSGGQKQRLAIAGALAMRPRHLVLDEPTSMLDPAGRRDVLGVLDSMRAEGVALMLVTQRIEDAARADRVAVLAEGRLAWVGSIDGLLADRDRMREWGLVEPPLVGLAARLREHGVSLAPAAARTPSDMVASLCR